jgi:hypothetical protein
MRFLTAKWVRSNEVPHAKRVRSNEVPHCQVGEE